MATTPARPRTYDASRRRQRAEEEREATRRRVVEAAHRLFTTQGYTRTTVDAIAADAGVALQSVYKAGKSKAELLHAVADFAVAGDHDKVFLTARATPGAIAAEPDAHRQVEMMADFIGSTLERAAPVFRAYREAAGVDARAAADLEATHLRRLETWRTLVRVVAPEALVVDYEAAADTVWAIGSIDLFLLLIDVRHWSATQYRDWLVGALGRTLLATTPPKRA